MEADVPRFPSQVLPSGGYAGFIVGTQLVVASVLLRVGPEHLSPAAMAGALLATSAGVLGVWWWAVPLKVWDVLPALAVGSPLLACLDEPIRPWRVMTSFLMVVLWTSFPALLGRSAAPFRIPPPRVRGVAPGPFTNTDTFKVHDDRVS